MFHSIHGCRGRLLGWLAAGIILTAASASRTPAAETKLLWQIGQADTNNAEFALAPKGYGKFKEDGFFVVGQSDAKRDWPYVHPGPHDAWSGARQHTFSVVFGVKEAVAHGLCQLQVALLDTQHQSPPELRIDINGREFKQKLPAGPGDASIFGEPKKGQPHRFAIEFPAMQLRAGANEIGITTLSGSWVLYDWVGLEAPPAVQLADVSGTVVGGIKSAPVLVERDGKLMQTVQLSVRHFGEPTDATVKVEGAADTKLSLVAGAQSLEVPVLAVEKETPLRITVEVAGKTLAAQSVTLQPVRKWVVYLLPHSHVDIGYTHVQTDVEKAQWKYLEMGMELARQSATNPVGSRFKWNVEVLWAVDSYLKQATPEKRQQFIAAVKAGQVGLQALYGNELTGLCRPEELLRLVGCAQRVGQLCDTPVTSAMITDVPGYTWGMVPTFAHSGVKYWSIGPNGGDRIGHTIAAWGDKPFWWIGPNGKDKVLVWMTGTGYYRVFSSGDNLMSYLGRLEQGGYPYDFVQVRHCLGDNGQPDVNFAATVKKWNETHAYPRLVIATTDDMFRDFEQRYGDKIPTAQGDFTPYWEDGAASSARETAQNRASADRLTQAETLFAMFNPKAYPAEEFYQAWRNVVLYDEHTWGAHNSISQPDAPFAKSQWAIKRQFAVDAETQSRKLLVAASDARGDAVSPSAIAGAGASQGAAPRQVQAIDVINTTGDSYPYTLVTVPKELSQAGDGISNWPTGEVQRVSQRLTTGELIFRPCSGGMGAYRYYITSDKPEEVRKSFPGARAEGNTLATSNSAVARGLTLRLDEKTGGIASLLWRGRELVDTTSPTGLNDYFYLPGSDLKGLQRNGSVKISVKEKGPLLASLLVESEAPGCNQLTREYRLHALRGYVEIIDTVDKKAVRAKEGVHFGFGFNVPGGIVRMDVPWGEVRPETDQIPGACKNWFSVQRYVDISNVDYGVTWLTPDAPLVEVGGITANLIGSLSDPRSWKNKIEPSTTIYSWAMNNHWHTNYRAEQDGPTVFRYFIYPHDARTDSEAAARFALECSQPLLVLPARGEVTKTSPFSSVKGVQVTAFKPSEDGKAWILRLFNPTAASVKPLLYWNKSEPKPMWLSDNSEKPLRALTGPLEVPAWSIVTLRTDLP